MSYDDLHAVLDRVLQSMGMDARRAHACASLFADTTRDGVYSHGLSRFPRFIEMIRAGVVDVRARAEPVASVGALERWDGRAGPGNLNAWDSMARAIALAYELGIGAVALANTNHWMRGGTYGWQAANAGMIGICWTNTLPNLPPWGGREPRLGNNPLVIAVPRPSGHVVLDMAVSQFSFGALEAYRQRGERLPVAGGYDVDGRLTDDPAAIEASRRALPIGFWKGSGLALLLDLVATLLSGGRSTAEIPSDPLRESGLSQVFIAVTPSSAGDRLAGRRIVDEILDFVQRPAAAGDQIKYPGQRTLETRRYNLEHGIPVDPDVWEHVRSLTGEGAGTKE